MVLNYFGVLVFKVLVFKVLVFEVLVFEVLGLLFGVSVFQTPPLPACAYNRIQQAFPAAEMTGYETVTTF